MREHAQTPLLEQKPASGWVFVQESRRSTWRFGFFLLQRNQYIPVTKAQAETPGTSFNIFSNSAGINLPFKVGLTFLFFSRITGVSSMSVPATKSTTTKSTVAPATTEATSPPATTTPVATTPITTTPVTTTWLGSTEDPSKINFFSKQHVFTSIVFIGVGGLVVTFLFLSVVSHCKGRPLPALRAIPSGVEVLPLKRKQSSDKKKSQPRQSKKKRNNKNDDNNNNNNTITNNNVPDVKINCINSTVPEDLYVNEIAKGRGRSYNFGRSYDFGRWNEHRCGKQLRKCWTDFPFKNFWSTNHHWNILNAFLLLWGRFHVVIFILTFVLAFLVVFDTIPFGQ